MVEEHERVFLRRNLDVLHKHDRTGFYGLCKGWLIIFVIFLAPAYNGTNPVDEFVANRI